MDNQAKPPPGDYWNLPVAFYFQVTIENLQLAFSEVSGLSAAMELEEFAEGGLNEHVHKLPKLIRHGNLMMKRALRKTAYKDVIWIRDAIEGFNFDAIKTKDILVSLLNAKGDPIASWSCQKAFPVKWELDPLGAEKNNVLIESLEFNYTRLVRQR